MRDLIRRSQIVERANEVLVLHALADQMTPDGRHTFRSVPDLEADTRLGQSTIRKTLAVLRDKGLIVRLPGDEQVPRYRFGDVLLGPFTDTATPLSNREETPLPQRGAPSPMEIRSEVLIRDGSAVRTVTPAPSAPTSPCATTSDVISIYVKESERRYDGLSYATDRRDHDAAAEVASARLDVDDLRRRLRDYLACDGDAACCERAEDRLSRFDADRRAHACTDYASYQHPLWMFRRDINRFGHRRTSTEDVTVGRTVAG